MYWQDESYPQLSRPWRGTSWDLPLSGSCGSLWLCPLLISDLSSWFCSFRLKFFILQGLATTLRPSSVQLDFWKSKGLSSESCAFFLSFPLLPPISPLLLKLLFQKPHSQPVKPPLPVDTLFYFFFLLCPLLSGPQRSCLLLLDLLWSQAFVLPPILLGSKVPKMVSHTHSPPWKSHSWIDRAYLHIISSHCLSYHTTFKVLKFVQLCF